MAGAKRIIILAVLATPSLLAQAVDGADFFIDWTKLIQDEGVALPQRGVLNLKGSGIACVDNPTLFRTDCTASGGGGGGVTDATYWVSSAHVDLTDEVVIDSLSALETALSVTNIILAADIASEALFEAIVGVDYVKAADNIATATALASNPTDCSSNQFANAIAANGNLTCAALADGDVPDTITASNYLPLAGGTLTGSLVTDNLGIEFADSDTNPTCSAGEYKIYADLSETKLKKCMDGSASDMDTTGGTPDFSTLTGGTNTSAAMVVGTGASLGVTGSGTIAATTAAALAANGSNCSAGNYPLGVDASGAVETCTADDDVPESGDFGNGVDLESDGSVSSGAITTAKVEAELKTVTLSWAISDPATADSANIQWEPPYAVTITRVDCSTDTGTMTIQMDERVLTTPNTGGTDVMTAQLVCDNDNQQTTAFDNAGIAAGALLNIDIDAVASTPAQGRIHVRYTID